MSKKNRRLRRDLHLDKHTSHGGWPGGHRGSWNDPTPVNDQIYNWIESMGLDSDPRWARLSESEVKYVVREVAKKRIQKNSIKHANYKKVLLEQVYADLDNSLEIESDQLTNQTLQSIDVPTYEHIIRLLAAFLPPVAALQVLRSIIAGDFIGAASNLPFINIIHTPEALYSLLMKGMTALPIEYQEKIHNSEAVMKLIRLLYTLKEVTNASDLSDFYDKLKALLRASIPAMVAMSVILISLAGFCQITAAGEAGLAMSMIGVGIAIETATAGAATVLAPVVLPIISGIVSLAVFTEAICLSIAVVAGVGGVTAGAMAPLIQFLAKIPIEEEEIMNQRFSDEMYAWFSANIMDPVEKEHKERQQQIDMEKSETTMTQPQDDIMVNESKIRQIVRSTLRQKLQYQY